MTRLRGRSPRGKRLYASAPCGRWQTTTMIGAVRQNGQTACMTIEGAINAEVFRVYVRDVLLPTLQAGDILVMDNLSSHKDRQSLEMLNEAGVIVRFLPAYSPDYNPIELMWAKIRGFYFDYNYERKLLGDIWSLASYFTMWAGMATEEQARRMQLADESF